VNGRLLYNVLHKNGVNGNLPKSIQSIYSNVKSCVCLKQQNVVLNRLRVPLGLRQGCNLSPILFILFINELPKKFQEHGIRGIQLFPDITENVMLLFADDIASIADTIA